jgi:hypothetical protein
MNSQNRTHNLEFYVADHLDEQLGWTLKINILSYPERFDAVNEIIKQVSEQPRYFSGSINYRNSC